MVSLNFRRAFSSGGTGRGSTPRLNVIKFGLKCQKCQTETKNVKIVTHNVNAGVWSPWPPVSDFLINFGIVNDRDNI